MLEKRVKSGLAVTPRHLKLCDDNLRRAGVGSRNDFVEQAIEFYCSHLMSRELSMLGGRSQVPMERFESLCRSLGTGQYKLSVEIATMAHILVRIAQVPDSEIRAIQTDCAQEVKRLGALPHSCKAPAGSGTVSRRTTARASSWTTAKRTPISCKSK